MKLYLFIFIFSVFTAAIILIFKKNQDSKEEFMLNDMVKNLKNGEIGKIISTGFDDVHDIVLLSGDIVPMKESEMEKIKDK